MASRKLRKKSAKSRSKSTSEQTPTINPATAKWKVVPLTGYSQLVLLSDPETEMPIAWQVHIHGHFELHIDSRFYDDVTEVLKGTNSAQPRKIDFYKEKRVWIDCRYTQKVLNTLSAKLKDRGTKPTDLTGESKALALLIQNPEWTKMKIASEVPCARPTLYKWPRFMKACELLESGRHDVPKGTKDRESGIVEAWDADD